MALPNLADASVLAMLVMAIVSAVKKGVPRLGGGGTLVVAGGTSLTLAWLWTLRGPVNLAIACETTLTAILAWVEAVVGSWLVRNPVRPEPK